MAADVSLQVLIQSVFDATGYRMNDAEAGKLKTAVAQMGTVSRTVNEEDAKGTDKLVLKKRELAHVINALGGQAVPELGKALSMFAYGAGPAAAIFALAGVFELVKKHIEAAKKAAEELAQAKWDTLRQSIDEAVSSANDLADALEKAKHPADDIKTAFEGHKALLDAQIEDHKKLLELMEQEDIAAAKGDKAKEAAIHARYADIKRENDLKAEQLRIDQISIELATRKGHQFELADKAFDARAALKTAQNDPAFHAAFNANQGKERGALVSDAADAQIALKMAGEAQRQLGSQGRKPGDPEYDRTIAMQQDAQKRINAVAEFDKNTKVVAEHTEAVRLLRKKVADADAATTANQTAITEETTQRDSALDIFKEHQRAARQQQQMSDVDAAGGPQAVIAAGASAINAAAHGQKITAAQAQAIILYREAFDSVHAAVTKMVDIARTDATRGKNLEQTVAELLRDYQNLRSSLPRGSTTNQ